MAETIERNRKLLALAKARKLLQDAEYMLRILPQGEDSGLDADTVDGLHAAEIIAEAVAEVSAKIMSKLRVGGGGARGMQMHGNEWHDPAFEQLGLSLLLDGSRKMTGDLDLDDNRLLTSNLLLKERTSTRLAIRNAADSDYRDLEYRYLFGSLLMALGGELNIRPSLYYVDTSTKVRLLSGNGSAWVEHISMQGGIASYGDITFAAGKTLKVGNISVIGAVSGQTKYFPVDDNGVTRYVPMYDLGG